jgi:hypothetical protein
MDAHLRVFARPSFVLSWPRTRLQDAGEPPRDEFVHLQALHMVLELLGIPTPAKVVEQQVRAHGLALVPAAQRVQQLVRGLVADARVLQRRPERVHMDLIRRQHALPPPSIVRL